MAEARNRAGLCPESTIDSIKSYIDDIELGLSAINQIAWHHREYQPCAIIDWLYTPVNEDIERLRAQVEKLEAGVGS